MNNNKQIDKIIYIYIRQIDIIYINKNLDKIKV